MARSNARLTMGSVASKAENQINEKILDFGLRIGNDSLYELGANRQTELPLNVLEGARWQMAQNFQEATRVKFAELGFTLPTYEVKEFTDERGGTWRLRVEDKVGMRSYEMELAPDRVDPKQLNVHAVAYSSLRELSKANQLDEWKGNFKTDGEVRIYLEAINAAAMVLLWLDPLAAPEIA